MQLTVNIPEASVPFFVELVQNLGFDITEGHPAPARTVLTADQIALVKAEQNKIRANPDYLLDWDDAGKMSS